MTEKKKIMDMGSQPLDRIMEDSGIRNPDLVQCSSEQLTHKMVAKARRGRRVTLNVQKKILNALNAWSANNSFTLQDLFNYAGK